MRGLLVCGFFLVGLPNVIGLVFGACARVGLLCARPYWDANVPTVVGNVVTGVVTFFAVQVVAAALPVRLGQLLPVVAATWFAIHFTLLRRVREFVPASIGLLCGWLASSIFLNGISRKEEVWVWVVQYML